MLEILADRPSIVGKLNQIVFTFTVMSVMYWVLLFLAIVVLTKATLGQDDANLAGAVSATAIVGVFDLWFAVNLCRKVSSAKLSMDEASFTIRAMQNFYRASEHRFEFGEVQRVIFGQRLNGLERFMDKLDKFGVPRTSQEFSKELKAGRLFVHTEDGKRTKFLLVDKSFSEPQLLRFFQALDENNVEIVGPA